MKKMPYKHTCPSTSKVEQNCAASNAWVKDRVIEKIKERSFYQCHCLEEVVWKRSIASSCLIMQYGMVGKWHEMTYWALWRILLIMHLFQGRVGEQV
jgi:hypothetical protein